MHVTHSLWVMTSDVEKGQYSFLTRGVKEGIFHIIHLANRILHSMTFFTPIFDGGGEGRNLLYNSSHKQNITPVVQYWLE